MPELTMGSLFDGIGGFPLAAIRNGITPVWASEIEPFPIEVTKTHFPDMLHVGDINRRRRSTMRRRLFLPRWTVICRIFNLKTAICVTLRRAPVQKSMAHTACSVGRKMRT